MTNSESIFQVAAPENNDMFKPGTIRLTGTVNSGWVTSVPISSDTYLIQITQDSNLIILDLDAGQIILMKIQQPNE